MHRTKLNGHEPDTDIFQASYTKNPALNQKVKVLLVLPSAGRTSRFQILYISTGLDLDPKELDWPRVYTVHSVPYCMC